MKQLFRIIWENSMLRSASFIHAVGETEVGDLREQAPETPVVVIPNGFSWGSLELGELGVSEPSGKIAYCGRLRNPQKGLDLLIEGFAIYRRNGGMMTLVMIGDGLDREGLVALAQRLGVNEVIEWKGLIFGPELRRELRQCEAFVHTSRFDVFPTACLEAAALGLPLIVSVETNLAELLRKWNAGWSYSPNTPDRIASVLATVENAGFQERRICGKNAAEMIRNDLSWQSISTAFTTQVEKALAVRSVRTAAQV
jgi:glycosyltransferase involved in cell wall biosynthesis